jgi:hypothetical protein
MSLAQILSAREGGDRRVVLAAALTATTAAGLAVAGAAQVMGGAAGEPGQRNGQAHVVCGEPPA